MRRLITAGPTREYLDDVRYLSNASSGRMGYALASAAIAAGHEVVLVTGPVEISPPDGCTVIPVLTTQQMFEASVAEFAHCDGVIGTAAVCDYRIRNRVEGKIGKTGQAIQLELIETIDGLAELGREKGDRWVVGFALESQDAHFNAVRKLYQKNCDAIVLNRPTAIGALDNEVELINAQGQSVGLYTGGKEIIAVELMRWIETALARVAQATPGRPNPSNS